MAKVNFEDLDKFDNQGESSFFGLVDDKDCSRVHFLVNDVRTDVDFYYLHTVILEGGKKKHVACLRNSLSEPVENCPLCAAGEAAKLRIFIPVYELERKINATGATTEVKQVKTWERGKDYVQKLDSLASRFKPLVATVVEVERNGAKNDQKTSYSFYALGSKPGVTLESFPPKLSLENIVLEKSKADLEYFVNKLKMTGTGSFPEAPQQSPQDSQVTQRTIVADSSAQTQTTPTYGAPPLGQTQAPPSFVPAQGQAPSSEVF